MDARTRAYGRSGARILSVKRPFIASRFRARKRGLPPAVQVHVELESVFHSAAESAIPYIIIINSQRIVAIVHIQYAVFNPPVERFRRILVVSVPIISCLTSAAIVAVSSAYKRDFALQRNIMTACGSEVAIPSDAIGAGKTVADVLIAFA